MTTREKQALSRIETMHKNGFSGTKIREKLEPRYSKTEIRNAMESFLFSRL